MLHFLREAVFEENAAFLRWQICFCKIWGNKLEPGRISGYYKRSKMRRYDSMKYEIKGDTLQVVLCYLEGGEKMINEGGSMSWMSPNMKMETTTNGGVGKAFGRMFAGEKMFQNVYTAEGGNGMIAFASSFPGSIR